jgi:ectoine hydroxylase-related dioxygenase (phytanoyl-CoA dioxygenase family)
MTAQDWAALNHQLVTDGVVCVRGALDDDSLELAEQAYRWSLDNPTDHHKAEAVADPAAGRFYQDFFNPDALPHYRDLLLRSQIPDVLTCLWDSPDVWFMFEHVFVKEGGESRATSWHQDSQDLPVEGARFATVWLSFDPIGEGEALEFVRGSHWGVRFAAAARSDAASDGVLPPVPDIDAHRERYDIVSYPTEPGDLLVFHPALLHGGAPTHAGSRRRTLSMRFFGKDAVYAPRPGNYGKIGPASFGAEDLRLDPGDPFRHVAFPQVRPRDDAAFDAAAEVRRIYRPVAAGA